MKKKYIAHANLPPRFPIYLAAVGWLLLDRLGAWRSVDAGRAGDGHYHRSIANARVCGYQQMIALIFGFLAWAFAVLYVSDSLGLWAGIFLCALTAAALNEVGKELVRQIEEMK